MSKSTCNFSDVFPTYNPVKSNRNFFIITFDRDRKISIDCVWRWCLLKYPLTKLKKMCHISKYGCQQGLSDESMDIAR